MKNVQAVQICRQKIAVFCKAVTFPWRLFNNKMPLLSFIAGRICTMAVMLFLLGFALFGLMELAPGDIVDQLMTQQLMASASGSSEGGTESGSGKQTSNLFSEEQLAATRAELGLDKPFYEQYFMWLNRVIVHHDLGISLISRAPVGFLIRTRLINSVILNLISDRKSTRL